MRALKRGKASLGNVSDENAEDASKILDKAQRAVDMWSVVASDFVSPAVVAEVMPLLDNMAEIKAVPWGGFPNAERCRILIGREELMYDAKNPVALDLVQAVQVTGNFMFDAATHRDFLGACLGTGIDRRTIGDIVIQGEQGAYILCAPEMVSYLELSLTQVRSVPVKTKAVALTDLKVPAPKVEECTSVEASMRLDAVASAGFRMSRNKMSDLVKSGDVRLNWKTCSKASIEVRDGDLISCSGKGRLKVRNVTMTKKGKYNIEMTRYL